MKKKTATQWLFDKMIAHNGILPVEVVEEAIDMQEDQMKKAYIEGFKRCHYIKMIEGGYIPSDLEQLPDDFDTYYKKNYGE